MTTPRDDIAGLSETFNAQYEEQGWPPLREAATQLDALSARVKELEAENITLRAALHDATEGISASCDKAVEDELRARVKELEDQLTDFLDPTLKSFRLNDGQFNMSLAGDVVQRVALVLTTWFRESGAKNYVEIRINARDEPFESYVFNVQKIGDGGKTPHELRTETEARALRAEQDSETWSKWFWNAVNKHIECCGKNHERAIRAEQERDEAYERAACIAESYDDTHEARSIAAAIRNPEYRRLASGPEKEKK